MTVFQVSIHASDSPTPGRKHFQHLDLPFLMSSASHEAGCRILIMRAHLSSMLVRSSPKSEASGSMQTLAKIAAVVSEDHGSVT